MKHSFRILSLAAASVAMLVVGSAKAAVISYSTTAPTVQAGWVSNLTGATSDATNVQGGTDNSTYLAQNQPTIGQTFTVPGTKGSGVQYTLDAVWLQHVTAAAFPNGTWYSTNAAATLHVRVTDPTQAGKAAFHLLDETCNVTGTEPNTIGRGTMDQWGQGAGTGTWVRFAFATPLTLNAGTQYGFDVTSLASSTYFFDTNGTKTDAYAGGSAYYSAGANGTVTDAMTARTGDHVFVAELTSVPEPASIGILGLSVLGLISRRRAH